MPLSSGEFAAGLRRWGLGPRPRDWRLPPIETYPKLVAWVQTTAGRVLLFLGFALLLKLADVVVWMELSLAAAVVAFAGPYRPIAAFAATALMIVRVGYGYSRKSIAVAAMQEQLVGGFHQGMLVAGTLLVFLLLAAGVIALARGLRQHPLGRRPVLVQHAVCLGLFWLGTSHLLQGLPQVVLWSFIATFAAGFWYLAYALIDQRSRQPAPFFYQLATFHPFFGQDWVPMGKGASHWRSVEPKASEELAVTQLKAVKLLVWAIILKAMLWAYRRLVYGSFGLTPLWTQFDRFLEDADAPLRFVLMAVVANFFEKLLALAATGHVVIAIARLAGFRLLRNTYRPLSSRSVAEFWNRYFYYFKEVLAHVYFYPTYVRWFKSRPELRLAFATFMAAGVGNFLFHYILDNQNVAQFGLLGALARMQSYALYCLLLSAGIIVSQLNAQPADPEAGWLRGQLMPSLGVAGFFCLLSFFDSQRPVSLRLHFDFMFKALGLDQWLYGLL